MPGNIVLIGFMGSGKTAVGRALAERLRFRLCDTDEMVEQDEGRSIPDIWHAGGEERFRALEHAAVKRAIRGKKRVIASGGGAILQLRNYELLKRAGSIVYLRASAQTLRERLRDPAGRPMLQAQGALDRLLAERAPAYEAAADVVVDVDARTPEDIAEEIVERLL